MSNWICYHCGMEVTEGKTCPICQHTNKLNVLIKEMRGVYTRQDGKLIKIKDSPDIEARYSCPCCQSRRVVEVAAFEDGFNNFLYDLDKKQAPGQEGWTRLKDCRLVNTICADCQMTLPFEDQLDFIEESERWLPQ